MRPTHDSADGQTHGDLGFMDLQPRLVAALRDVAGLVWGAADFPGAAAQGDFMHFDCGYDYSREEIHAAAQARTAAAPA